MLGQRYDRFGKAIHVVIKTAVITGPIALAAAMADGLASEHGPASPPS